MYLVDIDIYKKLDHLEDRWLHFYKYSNDTHLNNIDNLAPQNLWDKCIPNESRNRHKHPRYDTARQYTYLGQFRNFCHLLLPDKHKSSRLKASHICHRLNRAFANHKIVIQYPNNVRPAIPAGIRIEMWSPNRHMLHCLDMIPKDTKNCFISINIKNTTF